MNTNQFDILLYHGVSNINSFGIENFSKKHISQDVFYSQMKFLKQRKNVISIDELLHHCSLGIKLPHNTVVITFDDGFKNNYEVACPILDEFKLPCTFYISSGMISSTKMFWVDVLEDAINRSTKESFSLILDQELEFNISSINHKIESLTTIKKYCKSVKSSEFRRIEHDIQVACDVKASQEASDNYKTMTWAQLQEIDRNTLFTIGGHSMYHDMLAALDREVVETDILNSIELLENNLNHKIIHYSYPEGQPNHYNNDVISILKNNGIVCSPVAFDGINLLDTDPFHFHRKMVGFNDAYLDYFS